VRSIVTGGAGFIGSHLVDELVSRGDEVLICDDLSSGKEANIAGALEGGARLEQLDIADGQAVLAAFESFNPKRVFHLAAQIDVRRSVADPGFDARLNVVGTVNALEAATRSDATRFLFTSTGGAIYGEGEGREDELPFAETAACAPDSAYGQAKLAAEGYLDLYRRTRSLPTGVVRLGNIYGPRQDPATEAGVVAIFCGLAREGGKPTVFGDGLQTRDYVYVTDVVGALLAAAEGDPSAAGPFNVGTGVETTVLDLASIIGRYAGIDDFESQMAPPRDGEVQRTALATGHTAEALGWRAAHDIERGLELTVAYELER